MKAITIRLWRNPPRDEVEIDGRVLPHDVLIRLLFMDLPQSTTIGELLGTFPYMDVVPWDRLMDLDVPLTDADVDAFLKAHDEQHRREATVRHRVCEVLARRAAGGDEGAAHVLEALQAEGDTRNHRLQRIKAHAREGRVAIGNVAAIEHSTRPDLRAVASARAFDHEQAVGLVVSWSMTGIGFGELTIAQDRETGEWRVDDEHTGPDTCARIFEALAHRFKG